MYGRSANKDFSIHDSPFNNNRTYNQSKISEEIAKRYEYPQTQHQTPKTFISKYEEGQDISPELDAFISPILQSPMPNPWRPVVTEDDQYNPISQIQFRNSFNLEYSTPKRHSSPTTNIQNNSWVDRLYPSKAIATHRERMRSVSPSSSRRTTTPPPRAKSPSSEFVHARLYMSGMRQIKKLDYMREEYKRRKDGRDTTEFVKTCTFHPKITDYAQNVAEGTEPFHERLASNSHKKRDKQVAQIQAQKEKKFQKECTFHPKVSPAASSTMKSPRSRAEQKEFFERLFNEAKEREERYEALKHESEKRDAM